MTTSDKAGLTRVQLEELTRQLTDQGLLIEAGFAGLRMAALPLNAPADQLHTVRVAFFAGAQHLFSSIMSVLDKESEVTDKDLERLGKIEKELQAFIDDFKLKHLPVKGIS